MTASELREKIDLLTAELHEAEEDEKVARGDIVRVVCSDCLGEGCCEYCYNRGYVLREPWKHGYRKLDSF